MDTSTFVELVRNVTQVDNSDEDITEDFILQQGYLALLERFTQPIITLRNGTWLQKYDLTLQTGVSLYRIPVRSISQGLEKFEIAINYPGTPGTQTLYTLMNVLTNIQSTDYEGVTYNGRPVAFTYQSDLIKIYPPPGNSWAAHIWYYLRPSQLVTTDTTSGVITATPSSNGDGTYNCTLASTSFYASSGTCDLQLTKGNCEVFVVDTTYTKVNGTTLSITLTAEQASLVVANSTCVNIDDTTKYVQLPQEMANALVSYTSAVVLAEKGDSEKAQIFTQKCETAIKNIVDLMLPRSKGQPSLFKTRNTYLRRRVGRWGYGGWGQF